MRCEAETGEERREAATATEFSTIPSWGATAHEGAGIAIADLAADGGRDLIVLRVAGGAAAYRVGRALTTDGAVGSGWGEWVDIPGWRFARTADAGIAVADVDGDGRPELIVFAVDARPGGRRGRYRIGRELDETGVVRGGWSGWKAVPDWFAADTRGADVAVADLDGDGRPELILVVADAAAGGHYRVGRGLDATGGLAGGWSEWTAIPDWRTDTRPGIGAAVADLDDDGRPELTVFAVTADAGDGVCTVGWGLEATARAADGWGPWTGVGGWRASDSEGAAAAFLERRAGARPELVTLSVAGGAGRHRSSALALDVDDAATHGVWRLLDFDSQILAVHAALLHTGDVLFFSGSGADPDDHAAHRYRSRVWRYPSARFIAPRTPIDLFCAGQSFLAGGRLLVAGGTGQYAPFRGVRHALAFNPLTHKWARIRRMARARWYPTVLTLGDGRVIAVSGRGADGTLDRVPERFETGAGWRDLRSPGLLPWYAHLFLLEDGRIFYSGGQMGGNHGVRPTLWTLATGATTTVAGLPEPGQRNQSASVLLPPAQAQRVMLVGGGGVDIHDHGHAEAEAHAERPPDVGTASAAVADLSGGSPRYTAAAPLQQPRMHLNTTLLPDRTVVATGGARLQEHRVEAALHAEIYDPAGDRWTLAAKSRVPRLYHSVALLVPDGKVITAGSNPKPKDDELRLEVFSPPYLFRGRRPRCTLSADHAARGARLAATTPDAARLREVNLIRAGATTHAFNTDQRLLDIPFTVEGPDRIELQLPHNHNLAPPGWYMVFVVDTEGVPSVGRWLRLT